MESLANIIGIAALAVSTFAASVSVWRMASHTEKSTDDKVSITNTKKSRSIA
jgi:hypothetical protein